MIRGKSLPEMTLLAIALVAQQALAHERVVNAASTSKSAITAPQGYSAQSASRKAGMRFLPLQGGRNFRDIGGYRTVSGKTVRWGKVFRSGSMVDLTSSDMNYLDRLGIGAVFDMRSADERTAEPNHWVVDRRITYWTHDYTINHGDLRMLFDGSLSPATAVEVMRRTYRALPYEQAPAIKALFEHLAKSRTPVAFNCTAGKDRTGFAAALLLRTLGVPSKTVMRDYTLTNSVRMPPPKFAPQQADMLARANPSVLRAFNLADPSYLQAAFDEVVRRDGSVVGYLHRTVGVDDPTIRQIRRNLLR